jgi:hypothetical protein
VGLPLGSEGSSNLKYLTGNKENSDASGGVLADRTSRKGLFGGVSGN